MAEQYPRGYEPGVRIGGPPMNQENYPRGYEPGLRIGGPPMNQNLIKPSHRSTALKPLKPGVDSAIRKDGYGGFISVNKDGSVTDYDLYGESSGFRAGRRNANNTEARTRTSRYQNTLNYTDLNPEKYYTTPDSIKASQRKGFADSSEEDSKSEQNSSEEDSKSEQNSSEEPLGPGEKKNANGIIQKGKDLSSSNLGRQMMLELPELDANRFIQSEGPTPAPGAGMNLNMPGISADTATVPFKVPDGATPSFASELSPEVSDAVAFWKSQSSSPTLPSSYGTDFKPLSINTSETKATPKSAPNPDQFGGVDPDTASLVSPMYANAARNAARSAFLDAPNSEGPMGTIRRRNAAVGLNAAGNIAKIDGANYNVTPDQAFALTGGAGNTREGLDAIKNSATPYVAPGAAVSNVSERFDTSKLNPAELAAVEATGQPISVPLEMIPTNPGFTTNGLTPENAEEFRKRFQAALKAGA